MKAILANTAYLSAARIAQLAVGFTVGIYVARYLGPADWGLLGYAVSFAGLFTGFATLGLDDIVVRELAREKPGSPAGDAVLSTAFVLRIGASVVTLALVVAASRAAGHDLRTSLLVLIVAGGVLFQPLSVVDLYFQSRVLSKYVVYAQVAALGIASAVRVALVLERAPLIWFALVILGEVALSMAGRAVVYRLRHERMWRFGLDKATAGRLIRDGWPLAITAILTSIYVNLDQVLVKELIGEANAGKYLVMLNVSTALYFVPTALGQSAFPALVEARRDEALYLRRLQQFFDVLLWGSLAVALPVTFVAEPAMALLYGPAYSGAGAALSIHIWCMVVTVLGVVTSYWLVVENLQHLYPLRILASACTSIALNLFLIPRWGIRGAALAALIAQFVSSTLVYLFTARTRLMPKMQLKALALPLRLWAARTADASS